MVQNRNGVKAAAKKQRAEQGQQQNRLDIAVIFCAWSPEVTNHAVCQHFLGVVILSASNHGHGLEASRFSIVVPVRNEAPNIEPLVAEVASLLKAMHPFELIYVDDGSDDETAAAIIKVAAAHSWIRAFKHDRSCGQSAAQRTAIVHARAPIIVTIDGDGQNDPADIPRLVEQLEARAPDSRLAMVAGQRARRQDNLVKILSSRIANTVRKSLLSDGTRDTGCGLKAFDRAVYLALPYFDNIHRFYPSLIKREGYEVALVDVGHRHRWDGQSKYGIFNRFGVGIVDLLGTRWLISRRRHTQISEY